MLIVSSETALRTLLLRLLDIPPERICEVELPVGLPLVYSLKTKSLQVSGGVRLGGGIIDHSND